MYQKGLVWFKTDLRVHDNETLVKAIAQCEQVLPVYILDEKWMHQEQFGSKRMGSFRLHFLLESLTELDKILREKGSGLLVIQGDPKVEIPKLVLKYSISKVFAKREVTSEEKDLDEELESVLWKSIHPNTGKNCLFETFSTSTLYNASDLPFSIQSLPTVFTQFRKRIEQESVVRSLFETPEKIKSPTIETLKLPSIEDLGFEANPSDSKAAFNLAGGELIGLLHLDNYIFKKQLVKSYKETRNGLIGMDYSTKFSPFLALGSISPRMIFHEIKRFEKEHGSNESTYWVIFELLWRDFFRFNFKKNKEKLFQFNGISKIKTPPKQIITKAINQWITGSTKCEFVNANMRELAATGFMSNRGRQNVASYFIHELNQDWRIGAAYFEQQLIDYDAASNWGNWAYLAGVGNDPRDGRQFDTEKQATMYDKQGNYRKLWAK